MRIYIITMDDPIQTYRFVKDIIDAKVDQIVGLAVPKGNRLTLSKGKSKISYIFSLLLIMGFWHFLINSLRTVIFKIKIRLFAFGIGNNPSIAAYASNMNIPTKSIITPNGKKFKNYLKSLDVDIIINQSQNILKKELLEIPKIGVLNRHNALLPKNRGRLTPFWVIYNQEKETGVSIHFVEEGIDSGDIVVQRKYKVQCQDNFNTIVEKNYRIASKAMIEALDLLETGLSEFIPNNDDLASYNTTPTVYEAFEYRIKIIKRKFLIKEPNN